MVCIALGWVSRGIYEDAKAYRRLTETVRETHALTRASVAASNKVEESAAQLKTAAIDAYRRFDELYKQSIEKAEPPSEKCSNDAKPTRPVALHVPAQSKTSAVSPLDIELDRHLVGLLNDVRNAGSRHAPVSDHGQSPTASPDKGQYGQRFN